MANVAVIGNNCYADLHIYADAGDTEHVYSSLQNKSASKPIRFTWKAFHQVSKPKCSKLALLIGLGVSLVLVASSVGIGYFIGKHYCDKHKKNYINERSSIQKTTQRTLSTISDKSATENSTTDAQTTVASTSKKKRVFKGTFFHYLVRRNDNLENINIIISNTS